MMESGQGSVGVIGDIVAGLLIFFGFMSLLWKTMFSKKGPK
jgi:hypothetical protein